jgi:branched-chain amino acid transport system permease protein
MNWNLFLTELVAGITHGSVYALIALGYSMVYGILKLLNFAHGDIYMVGAFLGFEVLTLAGGPMALSLPIGVLLFLMFFVAMLGGGLLGVAIERFAYRRLRDAPRIAPLITALGVSFFLENAALLVVGADYQSYNSYSWRGGELWVNGFTLPAGVHVGWAQVIVVGGTMALMVALTLFVSRTQLGRAMRAVSFDRQAASMMGIDVDRVVVATFFIGSALAGAAALIFGVYYGLTSYIVGYLAGLRAFTAAVLGGIGNIPGAVLGGLVIGFVESLSGQFIGNSWSDVVIFSILIIVLVFRPNGLIGMQRPQRA